MSLRLRDETDSEQLAAAITQMAVKVYSQHLGREPMKAESHICGEAIVCVLDDTFTAAEQTLIDSVQTEPVETVRAMVQEEMRPLLIAGVERLTESPVDELVYGERLQSNLTVQVFLLGK